jgi:hypothetical protein
MRSLYLSFASLSLITACSTSEEIVDELAGETAEDIAADGKADGAVDGTYTYFKVSSDTRKCAAPFCGGFHIERLNRTTTDCHDGSNSDRCYTPELDFSESGLTQEQKDQLLLASSKGSFDSGAFGLVRGRFAPRSTGDVEPQLGRFIVTEAWVADSDAVADGVFVKVRDAGVRCIQSPCESMIEKGLNGSRRANIAAIDYSAAGLTTEQLDSVGYELFEAHGVIIAGDRFTVNEEGRKARGRTATAVYRRLTVEAPSGECFVGGCSGQVCSDQDGVITTCEWQEEYACYQTATCERQATGECGWTPTPELEACLGD